MIISGTEMRAQNIAAFEHKSGIHTLMQLKHDYGNNGMQDSQEYAMTVMRNMQEPYNPHKSSVLIYINRFDRW